MRGEVLPRGGGGVFGAREAEYIDEVRGGGRRSGGEDGDRGVDFLEGGNEGGQELDGLVGSEFGGFEIEFPVLDAIGFGVSIADAEFAPRGVAGGVGVGDELG